MMTLLVNLEPSDISEIDRLRLVVLESSLPITTCVYTSIWTRVANK